MKRTSTFLLTLSLAMAFGTNASAQTDGIDANSIWGKHITDVSAAVTSLDGLTDGYYLMWNYGRKTFAHEQSNGHLYASSINGVSIESPTVEELKAALVGKSLTNYVIYVDKDETNAGKYTLKVHSGKYIPEPAGSMNSNNTAFSYTVTFDDQNHFRLRKEDGQALDCKGTEINGVPTPGSSGDLTSWNVGTTHENQCWMFYPVTMETTTAEAGKTYVVRNAHFKTGYFGVNDATNASKEYNASDNPCKYIQFIAGSEGKFKLYNKWTEKYLKDDLSWGDEASAFGYYVTEATDTKTLRIYKQADGHNSLHLSGGPIFWTNDAGASQWQIEEVTDDSINTATTNYLTSLTTEANNSENTAYATVAHGEGSAYAQAVANVRNLQNATYATLQPLYTAYLNSRKPALNENKYYQIINANAAENVITQGYISTEPIACDANGDLQASANRQVRRTNGASIIPTLWQFKKDAESGDYKIYNANNGKTLGDWKSNGAAIEMPLDAQWGGLYDITMGIKGFSKMQLKVKGHQINAYGGNTADYIANYDNNTDNGSYWYIKEVTEIPVTISTTAHWGSAKYPFAVNLPEGLKAYAASGVTAEGVTLTEITGTIPANTPVLLEDTKHGDGSFNLTIDATNTATYEGTNLFDGATARREGFTEGQYYALALGENNAAVLKQNAAAVTAMPCNKAYLLSSKVTEATTPSATLALHIGGNVTGIDSLIGTASKNVTYYDLNGRKVENPSNGIFVTSTGKKVFIK